MTEDFIQFKKQRDLGEIISDTFKFLRQNYKSFLKLLLKIAGPVLLIVALALSYNTYLMGGSFSFFSTASEEDIVIFFISLFVLMASLLVFYVLLYATILFFIDSYISNDGIVDENEVKQNVKNSFGNLLGLLFLVSVVTFIGLFLCVFPGVYLWVPLSLAPTILVFRKTSVFDAFGESFNLIKDNWWVTFGCLLVIYILMYIISLIFQIPMFIYIFVKAITVSQEGNIADPASLVDWVYLLLNVLSSLFQYILSIIVVVATAFIYFDLNEKKNLTGTYETISNLGSSENQ